jgi:hypothetical protein
MSYKIDKSVPMPANVQTTREKYPLAELEVGDSFFVALTDPKQVKNLRSSMAVRAKKLEIKIAAFADDTGVRVWRTA